MSGVPDEHRAVVWHLLGYLPDEDVNSLATTVSRGMVRVSSIEEARNAVMSFSESVESILKRKKMKQEYIVQFLWDRKMDMPEGIDKPQLIRRFLQHLPDLIHVCQPAAAAPAPAATPPAAQPSPQPSSEPANFSLAFTEQLVPWYVDTFNAGAPTLAAHHFWPDADLHLAVRRRGNDAGLRLTAHGADEIAARLQALQAAGLRLVPGPELEPGAVDAYGRVSVTFRGCVHHPITGGPAGLFQQRLGLIRDVPQPGSDPTMTFKVKFVHLEVESQTEPQLLCGNAIQ